MPANKLALLRYKVIDQCLQNKYRRWTLEDLIEKVSEALYEYEGIKTGISRRTIQLDIQTMRSDKLGYNAPIIVVDRKYYQYEDQDYSITKANVSNYDLDKLREVVTMLNQFKGFNYFEDLSALVGKLEDKIYKQSKSKQVYIDFEKNELLKGLQWIDPLLEAVKTKKVLEIEYQSFKAQKPKKHLLHPYLLKEYRNRWFVLGLNQQIDKIQLFALDRIEGINQQPTIYFQEAFGVDIPTYFDNVIGVTKSPNQASTKVVLAFNPSNAPYVLTKPMHQSQEVLKQDENGIIISIDVVLNFELEREILGFGESVQVLAPRLLQKRIQQRLEKAAGLYQPKP